MPGRAFNTACAAVIAIRLEIDAHILAAGFKGETIGTGAGIGADPRYAVLVWPANHSAAAAVLIIIHWIKTDAVATDLPGEAIKSAGATVVGIRAKIHAYAVATEIGDIVARAVSTRFRGRGANGVDAVLTTRAEVPASSAVSCVGEDIEADCVATSFPWRASSSTCTTVIGIVVSIGAAIVATNVGGIRAQAIFATDAT